MEKKPGAIYDYVVYVMYTALSYWILTPEGGAVADQQYGCHHPRSEGHARKRQGQRKAPGRGDCCEMCVMNLERLPVRSVPKYA